MNRGAREQRLAVDDKLEMGFSQVEYGGVELLDCPNLEIESPIDDVDERMNLRPLDLAAIGAVEEANLDVYLLVDRPILGLKKAAETQRFRNLCRGRLGGDTEEHESEYC